MKKFILVLCALALVACQQRPENQIRVGVIAGPETTLMEVAKKVAAQKYDLDIKIVTFSDYIQPNEALNDGSIDANMFQHQPYLEEMLQQRGYEITAIAKTFVYPMALYSKKIKNLKDVPDKAIIAIPNDPSNGYRALLLLQKAGFIKLNKKEITDNPKKLIFKDLDAAEISRVLPDVTLAAINTNYAIPANLYPKRDGLLMEDEHSPYANLVVVRTKDKNDPRLKKFIKALHSRAVQQKAKQLFKNQAIKAW